MSKYLSIYTDELVKTAGLGQLITPMAKGLFTKGISNLSTLAKPALTTATKAEAPAATQAIGKSIASKAPSLLPNAAQQATGATNLATSRTSFLPNLPEGSNLLNDVHFARAKSRQALDLVRQRGTPAIRQEAQKTYKDYRSLMDQLSQYRVPNS